MSLKYEPASEPLHISNLCAIESVSENVAPPSAVHFPVSPALYGKHRVE